MCNGKQESNPNIVYYTSKVDFYLAFVNLSLLKGINMTNPIITWLGLNWTCFQANKIKV